MVVQNLATLVFSVFILSRASSVVVDSAARLSRFFNISQLALGFVLLSASTSLPELAISVVSSSLGEGAVAAGNVFGSNIANILLILGAGASLYGMRINKADLKDIGLVLLVTTVISAYIVFNSTVSRNALGFHEGIALLVIFGAYIWHVMRRKNFDGTDENGRISKKQALRAFFLFGGGVVVVLVSSSFVVNSAVSLAKFLGIAESFIGATVIAIGTSLPELSVDLQAIRKKHYGIALGDAIGSNMMNITLVLGTAALINPISITIPVFIAALLFAVIANILLLYVAAVNKGISRLGGCLFLSLYAFFIVMIFILQTQEISGMGQ